MGLFGSVAFSICRINVMMAFKARIFEILFDAYQTRETHTVRCGEDERRIQKGVYRRCEEIQEKSSRTNEKLEVG